MLGDTDGIGDVLDIDTFGSDEGKVPTFLLTALNEGLDLGVVVFLRTVFFPIRDDRDDDGIVVTTRFLNSMNTTTYSIV